MPKRTRSSSATKRRDAGVLAPFLFTTGSTRSTSSKSKAALTPQSTTVCGGHRVKSSRMPSERGQGQEGKGQGEERGKDKSRGRNRSRSRVHGGAVGDALEVSMVPEEESTRIQQLLKFTEQVSSGTLRDFVKEPALAKVTCKSADLAVQDASKRTRKLPSGQPKAAAAAALEQSRQNLLLGACKDELLRSTSQLLQELLRSAEEATGQLSRLLLLSPEAALAQDALGKIRACSSRIKGLQARYDALADMATASSNSKDLVTQREATQQAIANARAQLQAAEIKWAFLPQDVEILRLMNRLQESETLYGNLLRDTRAHLDGESAALEKAVALTVELRQLILDAAKMGDSITPLDILEGADRILSGLSPTLAFLAAARSDQLKVITSAVEVFVAKHEQ